MILCANYIRNECPLECIYADMVETYNRSPYRDDFITQTILYGTSECPLTSKPNKQNNIIIKGENNNA